MKFDERSLNRIIGRNLKKWRGRRGVTLAELAEVLGISWQQVQKYETGADRLSAARLFVLKHYLNVPYAAFFKA